MAVLSGRVNGADQAYFGYLLRQAREHNWRRKRKLRSFGSAEDWQAHMQAVREHFRDSLGAFPDKTPLNPQLMGVLERDGYIVEKLLIESQPGFPVTVNLYRPPEITEPLPAVLNPLGHWADGKAQDVVQARGIGLARHGYVALVYDPIGQGERSQHWDAATHTDPVPSSTEQHAGACLPCWLTGQTVINHMVWDGVRMLDYLETRTDVDVSRIGCTGASGGGTFTMFLTAFDDRIKAAVPVCSTATYERMHSKGQIGDPCQDPVGSYPNDMEMADLLMCRAPLPMQITCTTYDFFPLIGVRDVYADVLDCYTALGVPERANLFEAPAHHDYNQPMREAMYAWFNRWLKDEPGPVTEAPFSIESPETLWCTLAGQVLLTDQNETVVSLNEKRVQELAPAVPELDTQEDAEQFRKSIRDAARAVLAYDEKPAASAMQSVGTGEVGGLHVEEVYFESEVDLPVPGLVFHPPSEGPHSAVIYIHDRGKDVEAGENGIPAALARAGSMVFAMDVRGWGETRWKPETVYRPDDVALLGADSRLAYMGYFLGEWPLALRVADAIRCVDQIVERADVDKDRIAVLGQRGGGLVALHAAALDERIQAVSTYETLASYRHITRAGDYTVPASSFLPGVLLHYDLPSLVGALAPRPIAILSPVDAMGEAIAENDAEATFAIANRMFSQLDGRESLEVRTRATRSEAIAALVSWAQRQ
ncbi:MAG: acetylxylan esterase [Chloroflexota bacterium]|nr:acetylxylan esterase [Chloroflexota bacterium]MDE2930921.1 acetylxylan esterase [Chloroflexota bacterium]